MKSKKRFQIITLTTLAALQFSSVSVFAQPDQQAGKRRGPPPEAITACADQEEGAACSFSGPRGEISGVCIVPPRDQEQLICAPEGGPPDDRNEK